MLKVFILSLSIIMFFAVALALKVILRKQGSVERSCCSASKIAEKETDCSQCADKKVKENCTGCVQ